jgi:serine/threonine-protein kinase
MASVWLGIDARTGRPVAVKRMRRDVADDREMARSFMDEATLGLRLRHPNIVETIEQGEAIDPIGVEYYLVLEHLRGRTAGDLLNFAVERGQPVPLGVALGIVRDAARGLDHAHRLVDSDGTPYSIVHRDVSPRNVFVCESGIAKIIDFGIAKARGQTHQTELGTIRGTLGYLAPEQLHGRAVDARVDVFALGLVAYELLTGIQPLRGENDAETLYRLLEQRVVPPEQLRPDLPPAVGAIVMRALKRDRDRRLPSAGALADTIEASALQEGIDIGPTVTQAHLAATFPDDERRQSELLATASRLYAHLHEYATPLPAQLPASAPAVAQPTLATSVWRGGRRPRPLSRAALALGALSLTALAAASTAHFLGRGRAPTPVPAATIVPVQVERVSSEKEVVAAPIAMIPEMPAPRLPSASRPKVGKRAVPSDCAVYVSITKGPTVVCGGRAGKGRPRPRGR